MGMELATSISTVPHARGFFVVLTSLNGEHRAINSLRAAAFDVYAPRYLKPRPGKAPVSLPLLPCVLFVKDDGRGVHALLDCPGVDDVYYDHDGPTLVTHQFLQQFKAREIDGHVVLDDRLPSVFQPGRMLRRLSQLSGLFRSMRDRERSFLLLSAISIGSV